MKKYTHTGIINFIGISNRYPLRETKKFWVMEDEDADEYGQVHSPMKFRKIDGIPSDPQSSVLAFLKLKSIKKA